jgi:hypothetical protein
VLRVAGIDYLIPGPGDVVPHPQLSGPTLGLTLARVANDGVGVHKDQEMEVGSNLALMLAGFSALELYPPDRSELPIQAF